MKQILPGFYTFTGLMVGRVYMIEDPDGVTLIDTEYPTSGGSYPQTVGRGGQKAFRCQAHPHHTRAPGSYWRLAQAERINRSGGDLFGGGTSGCGGENSHSRAGEEEPEGNLALHQPAETNAKGDSC